MSDEKVLPPETPKPECVSTFVDRWGKTWTCENVWGHPGNHSAPVPHLWRQPHWAERLQWGDVA
jgi:hypothetical protein